MRRSVSCVMFLCLAAPFGAVQAAEIPRCPPSSTQTIPSPGDPGLVLTEGPELVAVAVTDKFQAPWSFAFLPDGSFLVTERPGHLQHAKPGRGTSEVSGIPPLLYDLHGGLLDVALDPAFAQNGLIYFSYLHGEKASSTMRVMRARYDEKTEALYEKALLFESTPGPKTDQIGGRIAVSSDGYLFLTLGELWQGERAQDLSDHRGASRPTVTFQKTIRSDRRRGPGPRSGPMATAIRRGSPLTARRASCGRPSTDPKGATSSTS